MKKQKKQKIVCFIISLILVGITVLLYILDDSNEVEKSVKIFSCIMVSIWVFFIPPTCLLFYHKLKNSSVYLNARFFATCFGGGSIELLLAPYFGVKLYFADLDTVKLHDFLLL